MADDLRPDDEDDVEMMISEFHNMENEVRRILSEIRDLHLQQKYDEADQKLRNFWEARPVPFTVVLLAVLEIEDFFDDAESAFGEQEREEMLELSEQYSDLRPMFERAYLDYDEPRKDPVSGGEIGRGYDPEENVPVVEYTLLAGEKRLAETHDYPSRFVRTSYLFLDAAFDVLDDTTDDGLPISESETETIREQLEKVQKTIGKLEEMSELEIQKADREDETIDNPE